MGEERERGEAEYGGKDGAAFLLGGVIARDQRRGTRTD